MSDEAISNYFDDFDTIDASLKNYISSNLALWKACGLLLVVQNAGNRARISKKREQKISELDLIAMKAERGEEDPSSQTRDLTVRLKEPSGAAWQDGNYCVFDHSEVEKENTFFRRHGPLMMVQNPQHKSLLEVRLNLLIAHEFAHQVSDLLLPTFNEHVKKIYQKRMDACSHIGSNSQAERLTPLQVNERHFISSYACTSVWEYWAECSAAFSVAGSRKTLLDLDPEMHAAITELVCSPESVLNQRWKESMIKVRAEQGIDSTTVDNFLDSQQ